jgi:acyl carrier protein
VTYVEPRNETEVKLLAIWNKILAMEKIGIDDNFFDKGGNSIKIIRLSTLLNEQFGIAVSIALLFQYPTIRQMASYIMHTPANNEGENEEIYRDEIIQDLNKFSE